MLAKNSAFAIEETQRDAWLEQIEILRATFQPYLGRGSVYFEYAVPRMGKRIDVVAVIDHVIFVLEFKVGEKRFSGAALDQVFDYALDLKNFHETSHSKAIAPVLLATRAKKGTTVVASSPHNDGLLLPTCATVATLGAVIEAALGFCDGSMIDVVAWEDGRYCPTPTIIEAAMVLYATHSVADISRNDALAVNLTKTSAAISEIIADAKAQSFKSICFVTGVPGAGKTLVGLNIATQHIDKESELYSVFLSGNGPLVAILREALARDKVVREKNAGRVCKLGSARSEVQSFIQNVHHFRDDCLKDTQRPPVEHVALFDEAQRAWNLDQTASFMRRKKKIPDFAQSEPAFLISCMDRHKDWAVIVCLVGGGQEINTGEAGISEWIESLCQAFPHWRIHISGRLQDTEYGAVAVLDSLKGQEHVTVNDELHLGVSMRSFRAEDVSTLVKHLLDRDLDEARRTLDSIGDRYPIVITRDLKRAKTWLKERARGTERYGIVVSSQAERLKPYAIHVKTPIKPVHWFLDGKQDVRSSYFLEDVATEFHVQGLELDWACVTWDADFRYGKDNWEQFSFKGNKWQDIKKDARKAYQKNAYRVLLTRARQGMVIVVPEGDDEDATRQRAFYDPTFEYLERIGFARV
jgi:hypothetical protein